MADRSARDPLDVRATVRASVIGAVTATVLTVTIYAGSNALRNFDAALIGYANATIVLTFCVVYRYVMWIQQPNVAWVPIPDVSRRDVGRRKGAMAHTVIEDLAATVEVQPGAVVSKVVFRDETANVTVFAFDTDQGLTEHTASRPAVIEMLRGRLEVTVDGETYDATPGFWLRMEAGAPHALLAKEPSVMVLTLAAG